MMYPLVRELAADGVPVTVTCRVLHIARQPYYRWLACPVTDAELVEAYRANALFDAHGEDPEFGYRFLIDEAAEAGEAMCERTAWRICSTNGWWSAFGKPKKGKGGRPGPPVHDQRRGAQPAVGRRHHRALDPRRQALPVRVQGRLLQQDRGLLHRLQDEVAPSGCGSQQRSRQAR